MELNNTANYGLLFSLKDLNRKLFAVAIFTFLVAFRGLAIGFMLMPF